MPHRISVNSSCMLRCRFLHRSPKCTTNVCQCTMSRKTVCPMRASRIYSYLLHCFALFPTSSSSGHWGLYALVCGAELDEDSAARVASLGAKLYLLFFECLLTAPVVYKNRTHRLSVRTEHVSKCAHMRTCGTGISRIRSCEHFERYVQKQLRYVLVKSMWVCVANWGWSVDTYGWMLGVWWRLVQSKLYLSLDMIDERNVNELLLNLISPVHLPSRLVRV